MHQHSRLAEPFYTLFVYFAIRPKAAASKRGGVAKGFQDDRYRRLIGLLTDQRKALRLNQSALAERLGTHQQFVSRFETGERRLDVVEFADVARALGLDPSRLVRDLPACT